MTQDTAARLGQEKRNGALGREGLLARKPTKVEKVTLDDGAVAYVRRLSVGEMGRYQASAVQVADGATTARLDALMPELLVRALSDANGARLFQDDETELVGTIDNGDATTLFKAAQELNDLSPEEEVEATAGN